MDDESDPDNDAEYVTPEFAPYGDNQQDYPSFPEANDLDHDAYDKYIAAKLILPGVDGTARSVEVKQRKRNNDGTIFGQLHITNPLLDTSVYEIEFDDGYVCKYTTNFSRKYV
jgi:hypothetical protein